MRSHNTSIDTTSAVARDSPLQAANEGERLQALASYGLDDSPEHSFDAITKLAAEALGVPVALISIVGEHKQWCQVTLWPAQERSRSEIAFCSHVVADNAPLIVADATADARFATNPLVTGDPNIRFYAGVPLRSDGGEVLGALCAIDTTPRQLSQEQLTTLGLLGDQAMALLDLKRKEIRLAEDAQTMAIHKMFFSLSVDLLCTADHTLRFHYLNPAWTKTLGWSLDELRARSFLEFVHPDDINQTQEEAGRLLRDSTATVHFENRYRHKNGSWVTLSWSSEVADGMFFAVARDVTKEADKRDQLIAREAGLVQADERWRALFENMVEGVVVQDSEGTITGCNPAAETILGVPRAELMARSKQDPRWQAIREDGSKFPGKEYPALVTLATGESQSNVVLGIPRPNGDVRWVSINTRLLQDGNAVLSTFRDITEAKLSAKRNELLKEQERLVTTGTLAAGVGHEINNPLSYVLGNLEYSIDELSKVSSGEHNFREILHILKESFEGAQRIATIVSGLRALARAESPVPIETAVVPVIKAAVGIAMHEIRQRASLELDLDEVPPILADDSRLTQVLVNLLTNAGQAFSSNEPDVNRVTVRCYVSDGDNVVISVSDNGPGIPQAIAQRMYDPFFTTKPVGTGTGLGLSLTLSIVEALDGKLQHETKIGHGTNFFVTFKAIKSSTTHTDLSDDTANEHPKIVFIDDDGAVLRSLARLIPDDYQAITFSDPRKAIEYLENGRPAEIIFCDVMMPYLNGKDIYERVAKFNPRLAQRMVFITGGAHGDTLVTFIGQLDNLRLQKPFASADLHEAIALAEKRGLTPPGQ